MKRSAGCLGIAVLALGSGAARAEICLPMLAVLAIEIPIRDLLLKLLTTLV